MHRYPNTAPTSTLMHTVFKQACQVSEEPTSESIIQAAYQLSKQERITALEAELYSLCV